MTTETKPIKAPRTRKGVSDKTLYKYIVLAQERFDLGDTDPLDTLLDALKDAVMKDVLS